MAQAPPARAEKATAGLRTSLLAWYDRHRRDLPWRKTRDPYRVWVSEVMLQQTTVKTVLPYYAAFLERFPTLRALAEEPEDEVLAAWSGLGYYHRARNLHRGAQVVAERHGGRFPRALETALAVPGVGLYTASAVLSIAYGARTAPTTTAPRSCSTGRGPATGIRRSWSWAPLSACPASRRALRARCARGAGRARSASWSSCRRAERVARRWT
jgi:hypothetical protein